MGKKTSEIILVVEMKKMLIVIIFFFVITGLFIFIFMHRHRDYFAIAEEIVFESIDDVSKKQTTLYIVGDSWAYYHKPYDVQLANMIKLRTDKEVSISSFGICGLTTKGIYQNMFDKTSEDYAFNERPDYCLLFAGINDADRKMGKQFYRNHMKMMIDYLLRQNVTPIVLEIPNFDIVSSFMNRDLRTQLLYTASMISTQSGLNCIDDYRKQFEELYHEEGWGGKVLYIHSKQWNPDGYKDIRNLYNSDMMHLNENGYIVLDSCIVDFVFFPHSNNDIFL